MIDWDQWRTAYPTLTYAEQQAFHTAIYAEHPEQRHYDPTFVGQAIRDTNPTTVVELGGWDGELAHTMLDQHPGIEQWTNIELCAEAAEAGADRHPRYTAAILGDYYWHHGPWACDLFVASHVIEHLTAHHLHLTLEATDAHHLYFDAPIHDKPTDWHGFTGTHILETGWPHIDTLCQHHGYTLKWRAAHQTDPGSGGQARACLYTRT